MLPTLLLVRVSPLFASPEPPSNEPVAVPQHWEGDMGKGLLMWMIGIPIPVIIVLWLIFH